MWDSEPKQLGKILPEEEDYILEKIGMQEVHYFTDYVLSPDK